MATVPRYVARVQAFPLIGPDGRPQGYIEVVEDVTVRARLEEQLRQAGKMQAIGQLAGGVAHDFRNQLTVIKGFGEMLLRRDLILEKGKDMMAEVLKAADRSATLTGQLLVFSRKEVLDVRRVDLGELVADIGKAIPRMVGEDVRLMIVLCARPCAVEIDPGQFQQVILNLVANARDAMPSGGELTVEVSCGDLPACVQLRHGDAKGGSYASVSVRDTGCGMDEAALGRIFEPFYTTKDVGKGTGLGLPMAYGFVQQSGGLIDVVSRPGMGSTFTLYFPLCPAGASPAERAGPAGAAAPQGDETVLVVEDETAVATMMVESLREAGYTVLEAAQANEALEILRRPGVKVDVLISDVIMPGCNGVDLAKEAREQVPALRVLFVSGYPGADLDKRGLAVAAATILTKPCAHEALLRKVREILDAPPRPNPS